MGLQLQHRGSGIRSTLGEMRLGTQVLTAATLASALAAGPLTAQDPRSTLHLSAPITRWDEAIPIGNGLLGGLLWGEGSTLKLSLDRGDLWDERTPEIFRAPDWNWKSMQRLVAHDSMARFHTLFDDPYEEIPYPTKLPGGRLVIERSGGGAVREFQLRLHQAEAVAVYGSDTVRAVALADQRVLLLRVPGAVKLSFIPPAGVAKLGYAAAAMRSDGFVQPGAGGFGYAAIAHSQHAGNTTLIAVTIATTGDGADPAAVAARRVDAVLRDGWNVSITRHRQWWQHFWASSSVTVPDSEVQLHYDLVRYFYGAAGRRGAPAIPLQGVWTADAGGLPPWKGDFHNDLNTQMTYLAAHTAGMDDALLGWFDQLERSLPRFRTFAQEFYGVDGAVVPGVMTLAGAPMAGWGMYSLSPTNGAWVAWGFWKQWRMTRDPVFLRLHAYPFVKEVGTALSALLQRDAAGRLLLPLSSSPEIHDNSRRAFLTPNSTYDQALLLWCFGALAEMARAQGLGSEAARWDGVVAGLGPLVPAGATASLPFAAGEYYTESHRHFSHAMAIHPLGLLNASGPDSLVVRATLDTIAAHGTSQWTGYSFSWFASMLARAGRSEEAHRYLKDYFSFTLRNGFHANGDQSGTGKSSMTYRPFTLEGNFLAMDAVQEMLLQSDGITVEVFPAVSEQWASAAFRDLRADGGFRVSARRHRGVTTWLRVSSALGGELRIRDPFGSRTVKWSRPDVQRNGGDWVVRLKPGESVEGHHALSS